MQYQAEYIEALQYEIRGSRKEEAKARFQRNISLALNIALIISVLILGQQIEKLAGL
jgi:hypothetical protein